MELVAQLTAEEWSALEAESREFDQAAKAPSTLALYGRQWRQFLSWCAAVGRDACPATVETIAVYMTFLARRLRPASIAVHLAALRHHHEEDGYASPTADPRARRRMAGIRRQLGVHRQPKQPLTLEMLERGTDLLPSGALRHDQRRAMLLLGFAAGLRRSELVGLDAAPGGGGTGFIRSCGEDGLEIVLNRSKADQDGEGQVIAVPLRSDPDRCPVRALHHWLNRAEIRVGPLFRLFAGGLPQSRRLSAASVGRAVKQVAKRLKLDRTAYAGHSLRSGVVTTLARFGAPLASIRDLTRHAKLDTLITYVRSVNRFKESPLRYIAGW